MRFGTVFFLLCFPAVVSGQRMLIDDFNDGNDTGWSHLDFLPPGVGPAIFDASTGSYILSSSDRITPTGGSGMVSSWDASADPFYSNGFLRANVTAETDGTSVFLLMRGSDGGNAYSFHASTQVGFQIRRLKQFDSVPLAELNPVDFPFSAGEEWVMEAGAVGDQLSLKVWRSGEEEPTNPQLITTDSTFQTGVFAVDVGTFPRREVMISGTFDDIYFTPPAVPGDFNTDGELSVADIDELSEAIRVQNSASKFDLNDDGKVNLGDHHHWITSLKQTWIGDANLDGEFNSTDLVRVFEAGQYEDQIVANSNWSNGDWNADRDFNTGDLVHAFQDGGYEQGLRVEMRPVPEPASSITVLIILAGRLLRRRETGV